MKKRTTVDLVEQSERVSFYSISFQMDRTTEFERFLSKFEEEGVVTIEERTLKYIEDNEYLL